MITVPFIPAHLRSLRLQETQEWFGQFTDGEASDVYGELLMQGESYSAIYDDEVMCCAGLLPASQHRAHAWALVSCRAAPAMLGITRGMKSFLDRSSVRRIETPVRTDFKEGHRLMDMLNFKREGTMVAYGDDGFDYDMYARIN